MGSVAGPITPSADVVVDLAIRARAAARIVASESAVWVVAVVVAEVVGGGTLPHLGAFDLLLVSVGMHLLVLRIAGLRAARGAGPPIDLALLGAAYAITTCGVLAWSRLAPSTLASDEIVITSGAVAVLVSAAHVCWLAWTDALGSLRPDALHDLDAAVSLVPRRADLLRRLLDSGLAGLGLVFLLPLFAGVALLVKRSSPGPVLFRQQRIGRGGELFEVLKFRTMVTDTTEILRRDPDLHDAYVANDYKLPADAPMITRTGRILRSTSLDELPQLWNVVRGEMALVGPRPIVPAEAANYGEHFTDYTAVRPGLTGVWQVSGRSSVGYPERLAYDVFYARFRNGVLDLYLLLRTIPAVLLRRGAK